MNPYETDELVEQYMEFHYGSIYFDVDNYPAKCAEHCLALMEGPKDKALDLGCAVGRTTFELARGFKQVVGVDLSGRFIECANQLKATGSLDYNIGIEGELVKPRQASLADLNLSAEQDKVEFLQEDACHLKPRHQHYDLIFAGNLLDRLTDPKQFLDSVHQYLAKDGVLVMSSPYTLLTEYTARENWLGGFVEDDQQITVLDGMKRCLAPHFELMNEPLEVPFVIRETKRKFQHTIAQLSRWQRIR